MKKSHHEFERDQEMNEENKEVQIAEIKWYRNNKL